VLSDMEGHSSMALLDEVYDRHSEGLPFGKHDESRLKPGTDTSGITRLCLALRERRPAGLLWMTIMLVVAVLLVLPFTPLTNRGYAWAMSQGDDELNALHFERAKVWYSAAEQGRPWRAEPKDRLKLATDTQANLTAGEAFFRERGNTKAAEAIVLVKSTSSAPETTAAKLAKLGFPDLALQSLKKAGDPTTTQQLLLTAKLELAVAPPQTESAAKHLEAILSQNPTNQDALEEYAKLKPGSVEAKRLGLLNSIASGRQ